MAQVSVTRRYRFCAAHRLHTDYLSPEDNRTVFGKCNNPNGHGHNYVVLVTVKSTVPTTTDAGVDLDLLDRTVREQVIARFDHHDLNQDPEFADCTTTGENLVLLIWDLLVKCLPAGQLEKIGLIETRDNYFEYAGAMSQASILREGRHG
ncbi:MAG TPA: 6-carboxytetrahydropterin synthase [Nitrospiraceae bacterium]|nr:6-carboxytetrahydropterin synthase [Nitrospiraceae bacterium]